MSWKNKAMHTFKKIFPPLEDRLFLEYLTERYEKSEQKDSLYNMCPEVCAIIKRRYIPLADDLLLKIRTREATPQELVHRAVWGVTWDLLACGRYHVYRGALRPDGSSLKGLWNVAVKELQSMGVFSDEDVRSHQADLANDIASVG